MFHAEDHLRFTLGDARTSLSPAHSSSRVRARNTDLNAFLDKVGLSGRARKL